MTGRRDEFLSKEDLDLRNLSWDELLSLVESVGSAGHGQQ